MSDIDIAITLQGENYMVENSGTYFKIGKREGRILERIVHGDQKQRILEEEEITEDQLEQMLKTLKEMGVIGKQKKARNHIFFYRIPLFEADKMFEVLVRNIKAHKFLCKVLMMLSLLVVLSGCVMMGKNLGEIFSLSVLKMGWMEYVILYVTFLLSVCLHELAHGTVCKYVGGKVGALGFMLIFFSPAMYCDISGIRMVSDRKKQILASSAGIYVNIIFMAAASIVFEIYQAPLLAAFIIMSFTTIISNLIPVIRLDGYWILSFACGITNLYQKSIRGVGKLFQKCSGQERFIAAYGIATYLFIGIALSSLGMSAVGAVKYVVGMFG